MIRWTALTFLLRSWPGEFLPNDPDRAALRRAAVRWSGYPSLTAEERDRIRAVWIEGRYMPPLGGSARRLVVLDAMVDEAERGWGLR